MPQSYTPRGFAMYTEFEYQDYESQPITTFTVQESSLATERKVWVGAGSERAHLNEAEARSVRDALHEFLGEGDPTADPEKAERYLENPEEPRCPEVCGSMLSERAEQAGVGIVVECERPVKHSREHRNRAQQVSWTGKAEPREREYADMLRGYYEGDFLDIADVLGAHRFSVRGMCTCGFKLPSFGTHEHSADEAEVHIAKSVNEALIRKRKTSE